MGIKRIITTTVLTLALIIISTTTAVALSCSDCDICVNQSGWWRDGGTLNASTTPIQAAVNNATAGETICIAAGSYTENVNVNKRLTLQGEGADVVTVTAASSSDHVFNVTADYVNISGFTATGATGINEAGIYLDSADHCNISYNTASSNNNGIELWRSSSNTLTSNTADSNNWNGIELWHSSSNTLTGNTANLNYYCGIYLEYSNSNTLTSNTANLNNNGIELWHSNSNTLTSNTVSSNNNGIYQYFSNNNGIYLYSSSSNTLTSNTASSNNKYGIYLSSSSDNTLASNNCSNNGWDIYIRSSDSTFTNNNLNGTNISFTYGGDVSLKGASSPAADPAGQKTIGKFISAANQSAGAWLFLNFSYSDADVSCLDESNLTVWKHNGTMWLEDGWNGTRYLDITENVVGVNITSFSIFAPVGPRSCTCGDICVDTTGWWRDGGTLNASTTPIQAAVDNATAGETIYVVAGSYTENVNIATMHLTLTGEGAGVVTVTANQSSDHVFNVTADYVNISGLTATGATGFNMAGIYLDSAAHCNISENNVSNNDDGIYLSSSSSNTVLNNTVSSNNNDGIYLDYSSSNTLSNNTANSNGWIGIELNSSSGNTLANNTASNNYDSGIHLDYSSSNTLTNNTANLNSGHGGYGIYLTSSNNDNTLTGNTANSNDNYGIYLEYSSNNTLTSNTAKSNKDGISLQSSSNDNTLTGNTVSSNSYGIYLQGSSSNTLTENNFSNNNVDGILMVSSSDNLIYNNYFNNTNNANDDGNNQWNTTKTSRTNIIGGPYLGGNYWSDYAGVDTDGDGLGDTILPYNSSGDITSGGDLHPLITGLSCDCGDICVNPSGWWRDSCAFVANTTPIQAAVDNANVGDVICVAAGNYTENVDITTPHLTLQGEGAGVVTVTANQSSDHVFEVTTDYVSISGFTATGAIGSSKAGIYLGSNVDHCNIYENTVSNNLCGIYLEHSNSNTLTNNTASSNYNDGISLDYSSSNTLANNTASNNDYGIYLYHSSSNKLANNTASNNDYGIRLYSSSNDNTLTNNTANSNNDYGIRLDDSSNDNQIYNNYFNNTNNAWDNGNNQWNTIKTAGTNIIGGPYLGGNYWSDYAGVDNDGDGLGDTLLPYNSSGNIINDGDFHPLTDATPPAVTVLKPDGKEEIPGDSVYDITWNVTAGTYDLAATPINISYSNDSGASWSSIASNELNDGRYSWGVPNINSSNCTVNVMARDVNGNTGSDVSNSTFTILETDNSTSVTIPAEGTTTVEGPPESNTTVNVNASGDVTVTVAYYDENPHPGAIEPDGMVPKYIDIAFSNNDNVTWPIYVVMHYTDAEVEGLNESSLGLYYYKDGEWIRCIDTGVNVYENYIWANVWEYECPGSPFGTGGSLDDTPPVITITTPEPDGIYTVGMELNFSATDDESDVHTVAGNLTNTSGVSQIVPSGFAPAVGVYTLVVTANDTAGNINISDPVFFVVYDPDSGSATGEGWFDPNGVSTRAKAEFEFAVKYKKDVSTGDLNFKDKEDDIKLKSTSIDWLVISSMSAQFQGTGTIKGEEGLYTFRVHAKDNSEPGVDVDHFDIKIWSGTDTETDPYHKAKNTISGGNIQVHTK